MWPPAPLGPVVGRGLRLAVNFHPDRLAGDGRSSRPRPRTAPTARSSSPARATAGSPHSPAAIAGAGRAGSSAGRTTPRPRLVYGALNLRHQVVGAAPRFGSSHFRLTRRHAGVGHPLLPGQCGRAVHFRGGHGDGSDRARRGGRPGRPRRLHRSACARSCRAGTARAGPEVLDASYRATPVEAAGSPARWNGTPGTGSPSPSCAAIRTSAVRSTSSRVRTSPWGDTSTRGSPVTPCARAGTTRRT